LVRRPASAGGERAVIVESISDALRFDAAAGLWRAGNAGPIAYPEGHHDVCFRIEDGSFWFRHRNRCITAAVARFPPAGAILDVGGGNGYVTRGLIDAGYDTALLEPGVSGARNARIGRGVPTVICATLEQSAIRTGAVAAVGLFDVLEHIEDDRIFVERLHAIIQPGGLLYLTVPSFQWLWSIADADAMHFRRYTRRSLAAVLNGRFELLYATYLFERLVPVFFLMRTLPYRAGLARPRPAHAYEVDHAAGGASLSRLCERLIAGEADAIASGRARRIGSSLLAVARRIEPVGR
jgi:SAM-dependent methyltransferase